MEKQLKIAVFIDFDNIEIGVKTTLQREFDVAAVLDSLKERGEIVTKFAYANWGRMEGSTRALSEHAVQMVQRDPSPRGDKNGADINLALDALEMALRHEHINAFAIVSGDSDFIALVNKLKQYDKTVFVVGGRAFTSTILQKNCHEFISYESVIDEPRQPRPIHPRHEHPQERPTPPAGESKSERPPQQQQPDKKQQQRRPPPLDLALAMRLVDRALQVLERREVRPQLGLLKSTMLQLDSSFSERAYGANSFTDFIEKLRKADYVTVTGGEGRYMISRKRGSDKVVRPEEALPTLRDVLETHRIEMEEGVSSSDLEDWVRSEAADYDYKKYGFQDFNQLLNYAQDRFVVRIQADENTGLTVFLGPEFLPPALPEPEPAPPPEEEVEEKQPDVPGQPTARSPRIKKGLKKTTMADSGSAAVPATTKRPRKAGTKRATTKKPVLPQPDVEDEG
ncbi:MAG TPA: NYN domain-containing protein [Bryobacteraceae bacterium]|jgi:uncharacterized protein (TIGR00288 family)